MSAVVKLAMDENGNEFAIKIFDMTEKSTSKRLRELMLMEIDATKNLNHKHICKYVEF